MSRSRHITFRISEQEYQDILAIKGDMSLSDFIRANVCNKAELLKSKSRDMLKEWASQPENADVILKLMAKS